VTDKNTRLAVRGSGAMKEGLSKRIMVVIVLVGIAVLFRLYHLERFLSLTYLKGSQAKFASLYAEHQVVVMGTYFTLYVLVTALSLPGAAIMSLAGGALFGFWRGLVLVSFASTIGATLACFIARFVLRDWVQNRFGEKLTAVNEGIRREGSFYLFTLRLVPLFPFFVINVLMGLTPLPLKTFYWVSQVGMLAGTAVYVNAGKELAKISTLSGILSPHLLISFVILGAFPLVVKKVLAVYRQRSRRIQTA
jgi:uncharacterized membrane protein YdjX (TVP38/TMEM64 family)